MIISETFVTKQKNARNGRALSLKVVRPLVLSCVFLMTTSAVSTDAQACKGDKTKKVAQAIAEYVNQSIEELSVEQVQDLLQQHYMRLRLIDEHGVWADPALENIGEFLLPADVGGKELSKLVKKMAKYAHSNKYLRNFLKEAAKEEWDELKNKADVYGSTFFPVVISYGYMLERLTLAMRDDYRILDTCIDIFRQVAVDINMEKHIHPLETQKLGLVEAPMRAYVHFCEIESVPADFLVVELPENIDWAVNIDNYLGYTDNGEAGSVLSYYHPNYDGAGETRFSEDGKSILISMPAPRQWADLYSTWNMAFVSHYPEFPMTMQKLLIPSVADYKHNPDGYIYTRSLALYAHLNYRLIKKAEDAQAGIVEEVTWNDDALSRLWGEINLESAHDYEKRAEQTPSVRR